MDFHGEAAINLDAKGRLAIPVKFREDIAAACENQLVITYNPYENNSLWLYPQEVWKEMRSSVMKMRTSDKNNRKLQRRLVGGAQFVEPDKGFRILIPPTLRLVAKLEKKVVMIGLGNKYEIWSEDALTLSRFDVPDFSEGMTDEMRDLVL